MPISYSRILIKLSGEVLAGAQGGLDPDAAFAIALELAELKRQTNVEIALVVGGGNLWRGGRGKGLEIERVSSDQIGMMATVMNAIALKSALEACGVSAVHQCALPMTGVQSSFDRDSALLHLEAGHVMIFSGGTGLPFFSTDTASALRAAQIQAQAIFKATQVDGIYSSDPHKDPSATRYQRVSYSEAIKKELQVMDLTAFEICQQAGIEIRVFKHETNCFLKALQEPELGSTVS